MFYFEQMASGSGDQSSQRKVRKKRTFPIHSTFTIYPDQVTPPPPTQVTAPPLTQVTASPSTQVTPPPPTQLTVTPPTQLTVPPPTQFTSPPPSQVTPPPLTQVASTASSATGMHFNLNNCHILLISVFVMAYICIF